MGAMRSTAGDVLNVHANLPPPHLLFLKSLIRSANPLLHSPTIAPLAITTIVATTTHHSHHHHKSQHHHDNHNLYKKKRTSHYISTQPPQKQNLNQALTNGWSNPLPEEEKKNAKPQPSTKNNQPSKQNCNPKIQPTHSLISPPCLTTNLTTVPPQFFLHHS